MFLILIAWFKFSYHELWKDEWQAWFVAKDMNISSIFSFLYYEGHPALWYVYLKVFSIFSNGINDITLLSLAHILTVAGGLYFLLIKFRLPLIVRVLFGLSYFIAFEYGIINRGYSLVIIFAFWAAHLLSKQEYNKKSMAVTLFLLCQTEVYGVMMALVFGLYILYNNYESKKLKFSTEFIGLLSGLVVFIISIFPRSSGHISRTESMDRTVLEQFLISIQGHLSSTFLPGITKDAFTYGSTALGLTLSLLCLLMMYLLFREHKKLLSIFFIFILGMIVFSNFFFLGGIRQWGMGFVFFIAVVEMRQLNISKEKLATSIIIVFCTLNLLYSFKALKTDYLIPFTNAEEAGNFIREKVPQKVPIVAINKFEATPVIGYARRKFYELPDGIEFSYFKWVEKVYLPSEQELKLFAKYKNVGGIIIISPKPLDSQRYPSVQLWEKFDTENYKRENYFLYSLALD